METPQHVSIPFVFQLRHSVLNHFIGRILDSDWSLHFTSTKLDSSRYKLEHVELVRTVSDRNVDVEVLLTQWNNFKLIWHGKKTLHFNKDQTLGKFFSMDFSLKTSKDDLLKGVITILDGESGKDSIQDNFSNDLVSLLDAEDSHSDVVLKCEGVDIHAHKCILAARSAFFAAMFRNPMKESVSKVVDIVDVNLNALRYILKYIYSGRISEEMEDIAAVLNAANMYQLKSLKQNCVDRMKSAISVDNVFDILVLGETHDENLKAVAIDFICNHCKFKELENTEQWKTLKINCPLLAVEVMTSIVKHHEAARRSEE